MKTTHHKSTAQNHIVVRNACSGRLILMALETSHLTSLACRTQWMRFAVVNVVNITMFTILIFVQFDITVAGFWEIGQLGSIYASAIISLLIYHYMCEKLSEEDRLQLNKARKERDTHQKITKSLAEGMLIFEDGKITFVNDVLNTIFSRLY